MSANVFLSLSISCPRVSWPRFLPGLLIGSSSWCLGTVDLPRWLQDCAPGPGGPTAAARRGAAVRSARQLGGSGGLTPGVPPAPLALPPGPSSPCRSPGPGWEATDGLGPCSPAPLAEGGPRGPSLHPSCGPSVAPACTPPVPALGARTPRHTCWLAQGHLGTGSLSPRPRGAREPRAQRGARGSSGFSRVPQALAWASACPAGL